MKVPTLSHQFPHIFSNSSRRESTEKLLSKLELGRVKKAGEFLAECGVFLSGFTDSQVSQLSRVLQMAGAANLNQLTASVTHVVMARKVPEHADIMRKLKLTPYKVTSVPEMGYE